MLRTLCEWNESSAAGAVTCNVALEQVSQGEGGQVPEFSIKRSGRSRAPCIMRSILRESPIWWKMRCF